MQTGRAAGKSCVFFLKKRAVKEDGKFPQPQPQPCETLSTNTISIITAKSEAIVGLNNVDYDLGKRDGQAIILQLQQLEDFN